MWIDGDVTITGSLIVSGALITRGGSFWCSGSPIGNILVNTPIWQAPFACTARRIRGFQISGSSPRVNARKSGTDLTSSYVNLHTAETWISSSAISVAFGIGDSLSIVASASNTSQVVSVQVDFTRP
jgi:hypothetical protein